jgi:PPOX class probable F420-dependent enzyme
VKPSQARSRFAAARVARLATVGVQGAPHLVPISFAVLGEDRIVTAVDHKPKRTTALRRLANIEANPSVALLADHYEEDWSGLWWARADGIARVLAAPEDEPWMAASDDEPDTAAPEDEPDTWAEAIAALVGRYQQYRDRPPAGPVILIDVHRWSGWSGA